MFTQLELPTIYICKRHRTVSGIPVQSERFTRAFDEVPEYHEKEWIHLPLTTFKMQIKPFYEKSFIIRLKRGKEVQATEVVDATEGEVHVLITNTFKGRFTSPRKTGNVIPATQIQVIEIDNQKRKSRISFFRYTKAEKTVEHPFAYIANLSPRQVRIEIEKAIKASNNS